MAGKRELQLFTYRLKIVTQSQFIRPANVPSWNTVGRYFARFVVCFLTMELVLHYMYVVAIKDTAAWKGDTPFELSMVGFWNLVIVWLKVRPGSI